MRTLLLHETARRLTLRILNEDPALRPFHEADAKHESGNEDDDADDQDRRQRTGAAAFEQLCECGWQLGDNAGHDDQADAVADAAAGNLFTEPHQEHGTADEADDHAGAEKDARIDHSGSARRSRAPAFEADRDHIALDRAQQHGPVAGILVDLLTAALALFLESRKLRRHGRCQLNDDRGRNVGHDAERDEAHALKAAAGECVEEIKDGALSRLEQGSQRTRVDSRQRHEAQQTEDDQRADREPEPFLEVSRLGEVREADIGCQLFGLRCHCGKRPEMKKRRR